MADDPFRNLLGDIPTSKKDPLSALPLPMDDLLRLAQSGTKPESGSQAPPSVKSIVEKLEEANSNVRKAIIDGKLNKGCQVRWVTLVINALQPIYGEKASFLATLAQWRKQMSESALTPEVFISRLEQVEHLAKSFNASAPAGSLIATSRASLVPATKNVFIIHGHDELNRLRLSELLKDDFNLTPEVLLQRPGQSATTIDKFEQYAERCSYAIALFTGDDHVTAKKQEEYFQARPNVIFETGWFVGRLGKKRVLILLQDGVKIYSDFEGVNRIQFSGDVRDKHRDIQAELKAAHLI